MAAKAGYEDAGIIPGSLKREWRVIASRKRSPLLLRIVKWAVFLGITRRLYGTRWFWMWVFGLPLAGMVTHLIYRHKTRVWTRPWGGWNDVEATAPPRASGRQENSGQTGAKDDGMGEVAFLDAPGARLAVFVSGGTLDPVILLHGGPGVPDYLAEVAGILAPRHRVIRYDQRGSGRSTSHDGRFGLADHVEDLEAIRKAYGHERLSLFGHSWGGTLGQLYAQRYPERVSKLFLCASGLGLGGDWKAMEKAVMAHNRRQSGTGGFALMGLYQLVSMLPGRLGDSGARRMMALVWRNYFDPPSSAPPPDRTWLAGIHSRPMHQTRRAALQAEGFRPGNPEPAPDTEVLFGSKDIYGPTVERLFARYPDARHVILENAGHLPWLQSPETFRAELCAFFAC